MPLQKQVVDVKLTKGLERASDELLTLPANPHVLQNLEFSAEKSSIQTRDGWRQLISGTAYSGDNPGSLTRVWKRKDDVLAESNTGVHLADAANNKWKQVASTLNRASVELLGIFHGHGHVLEADIAGTDEFKVVLYTSTQDVGIGSNRLWLAVFRNGTMIRHEQVPSNGANVDYQSPRVITDGNGIFYLYWAEDETGAGDFYIYGAMYDQGSPLAALSVSTVATDYLGRGPFDACLHTYADGGTGAIFLAYPSDSTVGSIESLKLDRGDGVSILSQVNSGVIGLVGNIEAVRVVATSNMQTVGRPGYITVCHAGTGSGLGLVCADLDNVGPTVGFSILAANPTGRVAVMTDPNNDTNLWAAWEEGTPGTVSTRIRAFNVRYTSTITRDIVNGFADTEICRGVGVVSDLHYRGRSVYIGACHYSLLQSTHHEIEVGRTAGSGASAVSSSSDRDICSKVTFNGAFLYDTDFGVNVDSLYRQNDDYPAQVAHTTIGATTTFTVKQRGNGDRITADVAGETIDTTPLGLDLFVLTWDARLNTVEVGAITVLAGACPHMFDGHALVELGFENYPEDSEVSIATGGGGGTLADGVYSIAVLFEWVDQQGNKHQSRPSVPKSHTIAGGGGTATLAVTVPTLRLTRKQSAVIVVYCSEADGTVLYRTAVGTAIGAVYYGAPNTRTADTTIANIGSVSNAAELLPTTGGVLPNGPYPACKHVSVVQRRIWFSGGEEQQLRYTEEKQQAFFPATNEVYAIETDTEKGRVSAVEGMDDKVIVFQELGLGSVIGNGPNRLGQQNNFTPVLEVLAGAGHSWDESNTIAKDSDGIWFRDTRRGLRHLNRGMQLSMVQVGEDVVPAGCEVDDLVDTLYGALRFEDKKQIRFFNGAGGVLVWDYENKQWSKFVGGSLLVMGGVLGNTPVGHKLQFIGSGLLFFEFGYGQDTFASVSTVISQIITTAWLRLGQLSGFQRLYRVHVHGRFRAGGSGAGSQAAGHTLTISTELNENVGLDQAGASSSAFGTWSSFANSNWQLEHAPSTQKCESVRITLTFTTLTRISAISLLIGAKAGMFKTARSQRF